MLIDYFRKPLNILSIHMHINVIEALEYKRDDSTIATVTRYDDHEISFDSCDQLISNVSKSYWMKNNMLNLLALLSKKCRSEI